MLTLVLSALLFQPAYPEITFRSQPALEAPAYLASYARMYEVMERDRLQTLSFKAFNQWSRKTLGPAGYDIVEKNPLLGEFPSAKRINLYFAAYLAAPVLLSPFPDWVKASVADTLSAYEDFMVSVNQDLLSGQMMTWRWPIFAVITVQADWDRVFAWGRK